MALELTQNDLRIIANAISWTLNASAFRHTDPKLTVQQKNYLQVIYEEICKELYKTGVKWSAFLSNSTLMIHGRPIVNRRIDVYRLSVCLDACYKELSSSELALVTELPQDMYSNLLHRISTLDVRDF
jgi:hypothetical protein